jgi:hypothetical protein
MARMKYEQVIVASVSNADGATTRGAIDLRERDGGIVTVKMQAGVSGLSTVCEARIMVAHTTGATPATGAAGAVWKTVGIMAGSTQPSIVIERMYEIPPAVKHLQIEFTGNTGESATVEAIASTVNYSA